MKLEKFPGARHAGGYKRLQAASKGFECMGSQLCFRKITSLWTTEERRGERLQTGWSVGED